jgi:surface antigen
VSAFHRAVIAMSLFALGCVGVVVAGPASATVTTLCTGYSGCAKAGMSDGGYSGASRTMWWRMYTGHNCTNYAAYRLVQSGMPNVRPWSGSGNATYWGTSNPKITDQTPTVGSIAWWKAGVYPAGSAGHVAYVERVVSPDEIILSQDSWGGDFSWTRVTRDGRGWPSGFIHFNDVPLVNLTAPGILGEAKVGAVLTATRGTWRPGEVDVEYRWRTGGQPIPGARSSTFTVTPDLAGKQIRVRVVASALGYPNGAAVSAPTAPVTEQSLLNTAPPTVSGEPRVGSTLRAEPGSWSLPPDALTYQWAADGEPLTGEDRPALAVRKAHLDQRLSVTVTAHRAGLPSVSALAETARAVDRAAFTVTAPPSVAGKPRPGRTLTLTTGAVTPEAEPGIEWLRGDQVVPGATGATYELSLEDLGARISARLTWNARSYAPLVVPAGPTPLVRAQPAVSVEAGPVAGGLQLTATVTAPGGAALPKVVRVKAGKRVVGEVPLRNGTAAARLGDVPPKAAALRIVVPRTPTVARTVHRHPLGVG